MKKIITFVAIIATFCSCNDIIGDNIDIQTMTDNINKCEHKLDSLDNIVSFGDTVGETDYADKMYTALENFNKASDYNTKRINYDIYVKSFNNIIVEYEKLCNEK